MSTNLPSDSKLSLSLFGLSQKLEFLIQLYKLKKFPKVLMISGKIKGFRASADTLFKAANVEIAEEDRHTAMGDALATAKSLEVLINKY